MSANTGPRVADRLLDSTLDALWRQWRAIGGAAAGGPTSTQVDPEALCLASLVLEPREPRLWTVMIDWLRLGAPLVSVQRLKNLDGQFAVPEQALERFASTVAQETGEPRFRALKRARRPTTGRGRRLRAAGSKQRSGGPTLSAEPALLLRLRAAFGVGVKADLLAFLLGQPFRVSVRTAASALGYAAPTVFRALQDLQAANLVRSTRGQGAEEYWMDTVPWCQLLGATPPMRRWGYWREILLFARAVLRWEEESERRPASEYARAVALRELARRHEPDLARAGVFQNGLSFPQAATLGPWRQFCDRLAEKLAER